MASTWNPESKKEELKHAGAMLTTHPWRGVLHTTEGNSYAGALGAYKRAASAPHFTVSFETGTFQSWQHIQLDRAATALRNRSGGVETNKLRCVQIEIVGHANEAADFPREYLDGIGRLMRWIESNTEIKRISPSFKGAGQGIVLATVASPIRLKNDAWNKFNGWCGHQHVPENDHWDPGLIDIGYLLSYTTGVMPMYDPAINIQMAAHCADPNSHGGWIVAPDGAVFAIGEAPFKGGANGKQFFRGQEAARIRPGSDFTEPHLKGSTYVITSVTGFHYGFPTDAP